MHATGRRAVDLVKGMKETIKEKEGIKWRSQDEGNNVHA